MVIVGLPILFTLSRCRSAQCRTIDTPPCRTVFFNVMSFVSPTGVLPVAIVCIRLFIVIASRTLVPFYHRSFIASSSQMLSKHFSMSALVIYVSCPKNWFLPIIDNNIITLSMVERPLLPPVCISPTHSFVFFSFIFFNIFSYTFSTTLSRKRFYYGVYFCLLIWLLCVPILSVFLVVEIHMWRLFPSSTSFLFHLSLPAHESIHIYRQLFYSSVRILFLLFLFFVISIGSVTSFNISVSLIIVSTFSLCILFHYSFVFRSVSYHRNLCRLPLLLHHLPVLFHFITMTTPQNSFSDFPKYFAVNTTFALYFLYNLANLVVVYPLFQNQYIHELAAFWAQAIPCPLLWLSFWSVSLFPSWYWWGFCQLSISLLVSFLFVPICGFDYLVIPFCIAVIEIFFF